MHLKYQITEEQTVFQRFYYYVEQHLFIVLKLNILLSLVEAIIENK